MTAASATMVREPVRAGSRLPAILVGLSLALAAGSLGLLVGSRDAMLPDAWGFRGYQTLLALAFSATGYRVARYRPSNPIGWLLLTDAALSALQGFAHEYAAFDAFGPGHLPAAAIAGWLDGWVWTVAQGLALTYVLALFPDGHPLSPRWRPLLVAAPVAIAWLALTFAFGAEEVSSSGLPNPFSVLHLPAESVVLKLAFVPLLLVVAASATSLGLRFRRARDVEQQQLKWLATAGAVVAVSVAVSAISPFSKLAQVVVILAVLLLPASVGIAILRYRLYDVDVVINRAIVYAALTAILAGLYSGSISLFQKAFISVTGEKSDAAVVLTTLILAATFTPIRTWLQGVVDRRLKTATLARKRLETFRESVRVIADSLDARAMRQRFLEEAVQAFAASGGRLTMSRTSTHVDRCGRSDGEARASADLRGDDGALGRIELCARTDGRAYTPDELAELRDTAAVVARALVLADRLSLARTPGG